MGPTRHLPPVYPVFDEGTNYAVHEELPELLVAGLGLGTHLGDRGVLVAVVVLAFWFGHEDRAVRGWIVATLVAGLAIQIGLKGVFEFARPSDVTFAPDQDGYSFPSGHAFGAAVVYGAVAAGTGLATARLRYGVAAAVITLVAASRVVLGVHYLDDVVAGIVLGTGLVWLGTQVLERRPLPMFAIAVLAAFGFFAVGSTYQLAHAFGFPLGGLLAWLVVRHRTWATDVLAIGVTAIPAAVVLVTLQVLALESGRVVLEWVATTLGFGLLVGLPAVAAHFDSRGLVPRHREGGLALAAIWILIGAGMAVGVARFGLDSAFYGPVALGSAVLGVAIAAHALETPPVTRPGSLEG